MLRLFKKKDIEDTNNGEQSTAARILQRSRASASETRHLLITLIKWVIIPQSIILLILSISVVILLSQGTKVKIVGMTPDFRVMELPTNDIAFVSPSTLTNWAAKWGRKTLTLSFNHYKEEISEVKPRFTDQGFTDYYNSLFFAGKNNDSSGLIDMLEERRLFVDLIIKGNPIILDEGIAAGRYSWLIEMPVTLSYENSDGIAFSENKVMELIIVRGPLTKYPEGIAIHRLTIKE
jgi:intracellular multiplication protein IcmL